jgi:hypothetical protein
MKYLRIVVTLVLLGWTSLSYSNDRVFSIPLNALKSWSEAITVTMQDVTILGHSNVHAVASDCEMHFGARVDGYAGDPSGWVLEPMNVCKEMFFGENTYSKKDWTDFGDSLIGKRVTVEGVPRIWPEHLEGGNEPSNPNHAVELHPLTKILVDGTVRDFTKFIYAPEGFEGGVSAATAQKILEDSEVTVSKQGGLVEIDLDAGRIGNFTTLDIRIPKNKIESANGGHRAIGGVIFERKRKPAEVRMVTVKGTKIDDQLAQFKNSNGKRDVLRIDALVLFSLDPDALFQAVKDAPQGKEIKVDRPLQLILYGESVEE